MNVVLAVISDWSLAEITVQRASQLAKAIGAGVVVYCPVSDQLEEMNRYIGFDNYEALRDELLAENRQRAELLVENTDWDYVVNWQPHRYRGIAQQVAENSAVLVVMAMSEHSVVGDLLHKPDDWHLLRQAPCPILFVSRKEHPINAVVASVDCLDESDDNLALNGRILDQAKSLSELMQLPLEVVSVVPDPAYLYADLSTSAIMADYRKQAQEVANVAQSRLLSRFGVKAARQRVAVGRVERVLEEAVAQSGLLVVGTLANKGLKGLIIGNTAERIISHVSGDLLVVN
jgi:universal stress protein E